MAKQTGGRKQGFVLSFQRMRGSQSSKQLTWQIEALLDPFVTCPADHPMVAMWAGPSLLVVSPALKARGEMLLPPTILPLTSRTQGLRYIFQGTEANLHLLPKEPSKAAEMCHY